MTKLRIKTPKQHLTSKGIEKIGTPAKGQREHFDAGFPGLCLRVSYGGARSWCMFYRHQGKLRRLELGRWPEIGLADARDGWRRARSDLARGVDPRGGETAKADTFANVVADWLHRDHADSRASSLRQIEGMIKFNVTPVWGSRRVDSIGKRDVIELLDKITDRAPVVAFQVFGNLSRLFRWCLERDIITVNPMASLRRPKGASARDRVLDEQELVAVWNAADGPYGRATRLLALTGARREEISRLKWSEIIGDTIELSAERTKTGAAHVIALSAPARALLEGMARKGPYVFTVGGQKPLAAWGDAKRQLDAKAKIDPWRLHDLRRTVATGLQKLGTPLIVTEAVLGHTGGSRQGVVKIYQRHNYSDEKRAALEAWGRYVEMLIDKPLHKAVTATLSAGDADEQQKARAALNKAISEGNGAWLAYLDRIRRPISNVRAIR